MFLLVVKEILLLNDILDNFFGLHQDRFNLLFHGWSHHMLNGIIYVFGQNGTGLGFYEVAQQKIKLNGVLQLMHEL